MLKYRITYTEPVNGKTTREIECATIHQPIPSRPTIEFYRKDEATEKNVLILTINPANVIQVELLEGEAVQASSETLQDANDPLGAEAFGHDG